MKLNEVLKLYIGVEVVIITDSKALFGISKPSELICDFSCVDSEYYCTGVFLFPSARDIMMEMDTVDTSAYFYELMHSLEANDGIGVWFNWKFKS